MNLQSAVRDLEIATRAVDSMRRVTQYSRFYESWQDFLYRIERAWEFTERSLRKRKGFQQWFKPYADQKKEDPLLRYLKHARHAETHAVSATINKPLKLLFREKCGRSFGLTSITSILEDGVLTIDIATSAQDMLLNYEAHLLPAAPQLIRFQNRDNWFEPPNSHLGTLYERLHPVEAAELGLAFYKGFVEEARHTFGRDGSRGSI